jgi:VWFA-related protein
MRKIFCFILTLNLLLGLLLSPASTVFAQDSSPQIHITQVDNSKFPQVTVYVSVTNAAGDPVGVDPSTIQISENGQVMQITDIRGGGEVGQEAIPVTTMLVIDISGSMAKNDKIGAAKEAATTYVSQMRPGDQAGLIAFDTQVYHVQSVTSDIAALKSAINGLKPGSDTAMYDALAEATKALESISGRKAIILLSDGMDNRSHTNQDAIVNSVGPSGLTISAIGLGDPSASGQAGIDEKALKSLTSRTGGQYAYATDVSSLSAVYQQYGQALQSEYAITYVSPSTLRDGVNRGLTVSLTTAPVSAESKYNPGGVLPEVGSQSWPLFGGILLGLLALLLVPLLVSRGFQAVSSGGSGLFRKKGRVKLGQAPGAAARGRVKMK